MKRIKHNVLLPLLVIPMFAFIGMIPTAVHAQTTNLPVTLTINDGLCDRLEFMWDDYKEHYQFKSPVYHLESAATHLRFTVTSTTSGDSGGGYPCFALAEFYIYDKNGKEVALKESNFSTNAQEPTEGPMKNICDKNVGTFFHTLWSYRDDSTGPHYIEVTLPKSMKDFAFGYVSRYDKVAPTCIIVDDADRLDEEERQKREEEERIANHRDTLIATTTEVVCGKEWDINFSLQSSDDYVRYTAMQLDIDLPAATTYGYSPIFTVDEGLSSHQLSVGHVENPDMTGCDTRRILLYSMNNDSIPGLDTKLFNIHLTVSPALPIGTEVSFPIHNIRLTTLKRTERPLFDTRAKIRSTDPDAIQPSYADDTFGNDAPLRSIDGRQIAQPQKGQIIISQGRKFLVR